MTWEILDRIKRNPGINVVRNGTDEEIDAVFHAWARGYISPVNLKQFIFELTDAGIDEWRCV